MRNKINIMVLSLMLSALMGISGASALGNSSDIGVYERHPAYDVRSYSYQAPHHGRRLSCPMNSASEGNANQQNFPVKQYGQTSGGNRC